MIARLPVLFVVVAVANGLADFYDALPALASNLDPYWSPRWDPVDMARSCYDPVETEPRGRSTRSLSIYYPPAIIPSPVSAWHHCSVPQIFTIDASMLARPVDYTCQKLPVFIQMLELPRSLAEAAANVVVPEPPATTPAPPEPEVISEVVKPVLSEMVKPVLGAIKSAACRMQTNLVEKLATTVVAVVQSEAATTTPAPPPPPTPTEAPAIREATPDDENVSAALATPPPDVESDAELIDSDLSASDLPPKMNFLSGAASEYISPNAHRCFIETISQPHLNHFTYELEIPH